jgi:hypothetical protein
VADLELASTIAVTGIVPTELRREVSNRLLARGMRMAMGMVVAAVFPVNVSAFLIVVAVHRRTPQKFS